jgi:hypothetical protein
MSLGHPTRHNVTAHESSRVNLINNGAFTAYAAGLDQILDTVRNQYEVVDRKQYEDVSFSFDPPDAPGNENALGYWDVYGSASGVDVAPTAANGTVYTSYDGGNVVRVQFLSTGSVFFDQTIQNIAGLRGEKMSIAISGYSFLGAVQVALVVLADGVELGRLAALSASFGAYRRFGKTLSIPHTTKKLDLRIELKGSAGSSVGLSGVTVLQGASGDINRFVPSIADTAMPANTVILFEGDSCPQGYRDVSPVDSVMGIVTSGHASIMGANAFTPFGGSDTHDHNPDSSTSALVETSADTHATDSPLPNSGTGQFNTKLFTSATKAPNEIPITIAGIDHSHELTSSMESIPPSFPMKFCRKL